ncbi:hypothetical protein ALC56_09498, partial [Trachymyrmex septentrionalis]
VMETAEKLNVSINKSSLKNNALLKIPSVRSILRTKILNKALLHSYHIQRIDRGRQILVDIHRSAWIFLTKFASSDLLESSATAHDPATSPLKLDCRRGNSQIYERPVALICSQVEHGSSSRQYNRMTVRSAEAASSGNGNEQQSSRLGSPSFRRGQKKLSKKE